MQPKDGYPIAERFDSANRPLFLEAYQAGEIGPHQAQEEFMISGGEPSPYHSRPFYARIRPSSSYILEQTRKRYDAERVGRIGHSIASQGQHQNGGVAYLDARQAERYLASANEFFGTDYHLNQFSPDDFGHYRLTIFGHNRQMGIASVNYETAGHIDNGEMFEAKFYPGINFKSAIRIQFVENTGESPEITERAQLICEYARLGLQENASLRGADIAKELNLSTQQVRDALVFNGLPADVRSLVEDGNGLSFSAAVQLAKLSGAYTERHLIDLAYRAAQEKWSQGRMGQEVDKAFALTNLPDDVRLMVDRGSLPVSLALPLNRLVGVSSEDSIVNTARDIVYQKLDSRAAHALINQRIVEGAHDVEGEARGLWSQSEELSRWHTEQLKQDQIERINRCLQSGLEQITVYVQMLRFHLDDGVGSVLTESVIQREIEHCMESVESLESLAEAQNNDLLVQQARRAKKALMNRLIDTNKGYQSRGERLIDQDDLFA